MRFHSTQAGEAEEAEKRFREDTRAAAHYELLPTPYELKWKTSLKKEPVVADSVAAEVMAPAEAAVEEEEGLAAVIGDVVDWIDIDFDI